MFVENPEDVEEERIRVQSLLENLRIDAILIVQCLSSTATYRCIINGDEDINGRAEDVLGKDRWWTDLKRLRRCSQSSSPAAVGAFARATRDLFSSLVDLSPSSRTELVTTAVTRRGSYNSNTKPPVLLGPPKRRQTLAVLPQSFSMRMGVHKSGFFSLVSSDSSSEDETDGVEDQYGSDMEHGVSSDDSDGDDDYTQQKQDYFVAGHGSNQSKHPKSALDELPTGKRAAFTASPHASMSLDDDDNPRVSFKSTRRPRPKHEDPYDHFELNFNILPAKAQYLILNDLIRNHSEDTAVVFTTLPAPAPGTYQDEDKSVEYVSGLELLCEDMPPVLLIHSNSLVVTQAL